MATVPWQYTDGGALPPARALPAKWLAIAAVAIGLGTGLLLAFHHVTLGGPGDQLRYYRQAEHLFPFTDNFYGPNYFVALRIVHGFLGLDWFTSGKLIGFASACVFLALSFFLFRRVLPEPDCWLATALVALNPELISESYSTLTILYGAAWVLAAIVVIANRSAERRIVWFGAGMLFGFAALSRTQAAGFLIGAMAGTAFLPVPYRRRLWCAAMLVVGAAIPMAAWKLVLLIVQGYVPRNYNFIHLTYALGEFQNFFVVDDLIAKYGSFWGVVTAHPLNLPRILAFGAAQLALFPLREGMEILGPTVLWLLPGAIVLLFERRTYSPWIAAFATGLFLTGIAARGWTFYYIPVLPLLAYVVVNGVNAFARDERRGLLLRQVAWGVLLCGAVGWAAVRVPKAFENTNWPEWAAARDYLNRRTNASTVVSTSAASLEYGARFQFVDFDDVMRGHDLPSFVDSLRAHKVTYLVVEERNMVPKYPSFSRLLADSPRALPSGLVRDTLITQPRRLAIYEVTR